MSGGDGLGRQGGIAEVSQLGVGLLDVPRRPRCRHWYVNSRRLTKSVSARRWRHLIDTILTPLAATESDLERLITALR
ncbi:hypothetical protein [Streptomyces sp. SAJ15]|uniref:hypothetical protein n=1 Tax=Streptomyces sp. SAJ15 TaxID=2011095 RepID=UPI0021B197EB|nr:hypothetical protein [Streptomyces sp. SAJ15]